MRPTVLPSSTIVTFSLPASTGSPGAAEAQSIRSFQKKAEVDGALCQTRAVVGDGSGCYSGLRPRHEARRMRRRSVRHAMTGGAAVIALVFLTGCAARRTLHITSDPPGATVRLDDLALGVTPLEWDFEHYGTRRLTVYFEGFHTYSEPIELSPPWWDRFPFDIFTEVLFPIGWQINRRQHIDLVEGEDVDRTPSMRSVLERAKVLQTAGPDGPRDLPKPEPIQALDP
jgi:hypothetical protein